MDHHQPNKNILNSNLFQTPLPLNPHRHVLQRPLLTKHSEEEVLQSFKIKRNALIEALQSKKEVSIAQEWGIFSYHDNLLLTAFF